MYNFLRTIKGNFGIFQPGTKLQCNHSRQLFTVSVWPLKVHFLLLTGSDYYSKCLATLGKVVEAGRSNHKLLTQSLLSLEYVSLLQQYIFCSFELRTQIKSRLKFLGHINPVSYVVLPLGEKLLTHCSELVNAASHGLSTVPDGTHSEEAAPSNQDKLDCASDPTRLAAPSIVISLCCSHACKSVMMW